MTITHATLTRTAMCDAIVDLLDVSGPGNIQVATTAFASILATITLANPAFGAAASGVATLLGTPLQDTSADNTGTAAVWRMRTSGATAVLSGTTTTSATGADITLDVSAQNAALNAINTRIGTSGKIQFTTAGDTTFATPLATLTFNATAFATASAGAMVMNVSPAPTAAAGASGTATLFRFTQSDGTTEVLRGSVGTSGADINFDTNVIASGVPVTLSSHTQSLPTTDAGSIGVMIFNTLSIVSAGLVQITSGSFTQP